MSEHDNTNEDAVPWGDGAAASPPPPAPTHASPAPVPPAPAAPVVPPPPPVHAPLIGSAIGGGQVPPSPPAVHQHAVLASTGNPVLSGAYGVTEQPQAPDVPKPSSKLPWIAAVLGTLVLLGGGGFFALTAFSASGGAETPEAAVDAMIEALGNEDFVTIGELIEPSERRTIVEPTITDVLPELVRLGVFDEEIDASDVEGVDWEFTDVTYRVEPLAQNPDMVHVYFTGGQVASEFNAAEFPFSDLLREEFGDELENQDRETDQIEVSETPLTFVQRDGRWYFSGWFSVAEAARLDAGARLPRASESPAALGSESPEAAVEAMFDELVDWNLEGLIGRMDPEEMAAMYRYSPLFLEDAQAALDELDEELRAENFSWDMRDFSFDVETDGDDAIVTVRAFTVDVQATDVDITMTYSRDEITGSVSAEEFGGRGTLNATTTKWTIGGVVDGESFNVDIEIDPDTYTISGSGNVAGDSAEGELVFDPDNVCSRYSLSASDGTNESGCLEDSFAGDDDSRAALSLYQDTFDDWPTEFPGFTMATHRTDGEWYVSPVGTAFDGYVGLLGSFEEDQLEELLASAGGLDPMDSVNDVLNGVTGGDLLPSSSDDTGDIDDLFDDLESAMDDETFDDTFDDEDLFAPIDPELESTIVLTIDRGAIGELADSVEVGGYDLATIDLDAGDTLIVTVQTSPSSSLDTTLTMVNQASGAEVGFNDDADFDAGLSSTFDSQLEVTVAEAGTYAIEIGSYEYFTGGDYSLTVERR